jgi:ParB-like chromosome segregation protein Spo0J
VTVYDPTTDIYTVIDGFHRYTVLVGHFGCEEIPVVTIDRDIKDRMAATVRHNRARGKHQLDLMATMVEKLLVMGWSDSQIAKHLGMEAEEVLRLRHQRGIASQYANHQFGKAWVVDTDDILVAGDTTKAITQAA